MKPTLTNRERAILSIARSMPKCHRRDGDTLRINLQGEIVGSRPRETGINLTAVEAALIANHSAPHVEVTINSNGGSLRVAEKIGEALRRHQGYKTVIADRLCASAGTVILMAGDFRQATSGTVLLFHATEAAPANGERWTASRHGSHAAMLQRADKRIVDLYAKRTGRDASIFAKEIRNEKYMSLRRALDLGVIDCMEGEEIWRDGRPYAWFEARRPPSVVAQRQDEFSQFRLAYAQAVRAGSLPRGQIIGHVAFSRGGGCRVM